MPERAWFERLARTPGESLLGALREHYRGFEAVSSPAEFERALEAEKRSLLELVTGLLQEERPRQFIRSGYDFDNCTHAWKAAKLGARSALTPVRPRSPRATSRRRSRGRPGAFFPRTSRRTSPMLDARYEETKSLAACEYAAEAREVALPLRGGARARKRRAYLRCKVDLINIKNCIRLRQIRRCARKRSRRSGSRGARSRRRGSGASSARRRRSSSRTSRRAFYAQARSPRPLAGDVPLWRIDPIMRRALMEFLGESRYRFFDFSPVLYHIELRERDYEIVRRIIVGRLNRLSEETTLERVNALLPS